ncbi:MAG: ABC transporter permease subunit [Spirochaetales bacterium]|nr:ABC transporter permease subunit [Spirochaetales bacterium]
MNNAIKAFPDVLSKRRNGLIRDVRRNRVWYAFVFPVVAFFLIFKYVPFYFVTIAFRDYRITRSIGDAPFAGLKYFIQLFETPGFRQAFVNTLLISFYKLIWGFPAPIILAVLLNELRSQRFKKWTQTLIYLPHFISWAVIGGILQNLLSLNDGSVNKIIEIMGFDPIFWLGDKSIFRGLLVTTDIWKSAGWGTIIYLASITRINPELYEAARIDGARRWQEIMYITLPSIRDVIIVLLILRLGNLLNVGFEQILILKNDLVQDVGDVLDTFVYRTGLIERRYSYATAAGLFKSLLATFFLVTSDWLSKKFSGEGLL